MAYPVVSDGDGLGEPSDQRTSENLSLAVYERIKSDILSADLPPRTRLKVGFVCERYGFGSSPVREALTLLSGEGFVTRTEGRGFAVADVSVEEYVELTETRCWLEEIALRNSMVRGGEAWENAIVVAFFRLSRTVRPESGTSLALNTEWTQRHRAFHDALISECGSRWLLAYCQQLREQTYRYRRVVGEEREGGTLNEHENLMKAVLDRRPEIAVPLLAQHYRSRTEATLARFNREGGGRTFLSPGSGRGSIKRD